MAYDGLILLFRVLPKVGVITVYSLLLRLHLPLVGPVQDITLFVARIVSAC